MKKLHTTLALALFAAFGTQAALAADAKPAAKNDCYEASTAPAAKSDKTRKEVKAEAKGAATECEASKAPDAASTKKREEVKTEAKKAMKDGQMPAGEQPKK
jgi:hypothetical protein